MILWWRRLFSKYYKSYLVYNGLIHIHNPSENQMEYQHGMDVFHKCVKYLLKVLKLSHIEIMIDTLLC